MTSQRAIVKSVQSGDTLVLASDVPQRTGVEPPIKVLSLAFVQAPRLNRTGDEPFAFLSREYLRSNLVGQKVSFQVLYHVPQIPRDYGIVTISNGMSVGDMAVAEGLVKVREDAGKREEQSVHESLIDKLRALEAKAKLDNKGLWIGGGDGITATYDYPPNARNFFDEYKGKDISAVVEKVVSGDRVAVRALLSPSEHQQLVVLVAGIRAPTTDRTDKDGNSTPGEQYGEDARRFVDARLHQRTVKIRLVGISPQNQLIGEVIHPKGSIAEFVLEAGLARCIDFHSNLLGLEKMGKLREKEASAKEKKLNLWTSHVGQKTSGGYNATVTRIQSGDTIWVRAGKDQEKKISLSSVRQPAKPKFDDENPESQYDARQPSRWQLEAKEFLRKKLIGKTVHVSIDGKRDADASKGFEPKDMATVTLNGKNVALDLMEAGLATTTKHRKDDTDRSPIWDELSAAEDKARADNAGSHNENAPAPKPIVDASESESKAKGHLAFLQRRKRIPAVVDYVSSGSRFKLLIPSENVKLSFVLAGIRAPRSGRGKDDPGEAFGNEALEFTSKKVFQRDVEIDVEGTDKTNSFTGTMYVNREPLSKLLVEEGLASVHYYSAENSGHGPELIAAEKRAKQAQKKMWHDWVEEEEAVDESANGNGSSAENTPFTKKKDYRDVAITDVDEAGRLKLQIVGSGTAQLEQMMTEFRSFHLSKANATPLANPPKVGEFVASQFTEDKTWYRARVRHVDREAKKAEVQYIDYGNSEIKSWSELRPLSQAQFSTTKLKAQAVDAVLSFCQFAGTTEHAKMAQDYILGTFTEPLVANVDFTEKDGTLSVTLMEKDSKDASDTVNAELIEKGLVMLPTKTKPWEKAYSAQIAELKKLQEDAKQRYVGIWEYGDVHGELPIDKLR